MNEDGEKCCFFLGEHHSTKKIKGLLRKDFGDQLASILYTSFFIWFWRGQQKARRRKKATSMYSQILATTLLISFIVIANQCAATGGTTTPTTTTTATVTTTAAPTTTVATACATCTVDQIIITTGNDGDSPPLTDEGVDANGCATITYTCERTPQVATDVVLITYYSDNENPRDVGTENGVGTANVVMNCVDGNWVKDGIVINEVECQIIT
ncbi:hypothetical protein L3Y34_010744 [Caenorhabditis briggsae]|uniref:C6 domain-containing protein n=1 Tax=Caenorhabditis briggsae TaxID=6238 RepID=A0AAE8ZM77_CAEBR|nr:hypothetical protein L3Y34_010744 [Caenorhabditis briggsae]